MTIASVMAVVLALSLLTTGTARAENLAFNPSFAADALLWNPSPFGTTDNTIAWEAGKNKTGSEGGSLRVNVTRVMTDNDVLANAIDGSVQFAAFMQTYTGGSQHGATLNQLNISAYVLIENALTEAPGISSGKGGAAVALIDGSVLTGNTGVITPDNERLLAPTSGFQKISAPTLTLTATGMYNPYLLLRNATGTAYFDDVTVTTDTSGTVTPTVTPTETPTVTPTPPPDPNANYAFNPDFASDAALWNPSPFGTTENTIAWDGTKNHDGSAGGSLKVTVPNSKADNSGIATALDGAVQFAGIKTGSHPAKLEISAYVYIDTPLTEVAGISEGKGGAAVAMIDGLVDFTGTITTDAERVLDNSGFQKISAPPLDLKTGGQSYNLYLMLRNAKGIAYFDDVAVKMPQVPAEISYFDLY